MHDSDHIYKQRYRSIGGKRYQLVALQPSKEVANDIANFYRRKGWIVRIVKDVRAYSVYARPQK